MTTNFYLGGLVADLASPQNWIVPTPPAKSFTILRLFLTTADFYIDFYNSITVEISAVTKDGISLPPLAILLTKPAAGSGTFFAEKMVDLVALGFGDVSRLSFLPYFTGSVGTGGQGPDGRILAGLKIDGDGYGGPVRYEVYTPLGCSS